MYTLEQSNLVNNLHSRLFRGIQITELTQEEIAAVREACRQPSVKAKAEYIMSLIPSAFQK